MAELTINDRIRFVLTQKKITIAEFAGGKEKDRTRVSRQINGTASISMDVLLKFLNKFPDISSEWLLRGEEQMMRSDNMAPKIYNSAIGTLHGANKGSQTTTNPSDAVLQAQLDSMKQVLSIKDELLAMKDKQINDLTLDKHSLQNQVNTLLIKMPGVKL